MGNNGDQRASFKPGQPSPQPSSNPSHRMRLSGLTPTDGQEAYVRAAPSRASRRPRAERHSYLVATGHLDPQETEQLTKQSDDSIQVELQYDHHQAPSISPSSAQTKFYNRSISPMNTSSDHDQIRSSKSANTPAVIPNRRSNVEQSFLEDLNRKLANSRIVTINQQSASGIPSNKKNSRNKDKNHLPLYRPREDSDSRGDSNFGKFRQTYTEVTLPMKTSPAFEYILKDHERRNKRCCLWLIYTTLLTMCLAVIIFCSVHLISRSH